MADSMKATGPKTLGTAKVLKGTQTAIHTSVSSHKVRHMGKEYTLGRTVKSTMVSGNKGARKDTASGKASIMIRISVSGRTQRPMDMECTSGPMVTSTRGSGTCALSMDKELIHLGTENRTLGHLRMEKPMVKVNTTGQTEPFTQVTFLKAKNQEKENGVVRKETRAATLLKVITSMTKNTEKESIPGQAETFTKATIIMMNDMETDRCFGLTEACTRVNGKVGSNTESEELYFQTVHIKRATSRTTFTNAH